MKVLRTRSAEQRDRELARPYCAEELAARLRAAGLHFPPRLLEELGVALAAGGLILLAGPSGCGKSSLAEAAALYLTEGYPDRGYERVAVRPGWAGPEPLVGTWSATTGRSQVPPFLGLWLAALRHKARRFFVLLDGLDRVPVDQLLGEVLAATTGRGSLYLHEDHLRCQPRGGLSDELANFFICHRPCEECFFVAPGYPQGVTDAVRDFVPARAQRPENLVLLATLDGEPDRLPAAIRDHASLLCLEAPPLEELVDAGLLPSLARHRGPLGDLAAELEAAGVPLSPRTWRRLEELVAGGICPARALEVRARGALEGLAAGRREHHLARLAPRPGRPRGRQSTKK